jgi:hypothetical protein
LLFCPLFDIMSIASTSNTNKHAYETESTWMAMTELVIIIVNIIIS